MVPADPLPPDLPCPDTARDGLGHPGRFATTRWSLVAHLRGTDPDAARAALETLCAGAWYPLYAFARRRGLAPEEARDATQAFFAEFLERTGFARADPERGRLRAYLRGAFRNFLGRRAEAERAEKRGGTRRVRSLDLAEAEGRYGIEPADGSSPERLFEAAWARALLEQVVTSLRVEYEAQDKAALFHALEGELGGDVTPRAELAARLETTDGAVKVAAHRLRRRYRELLRQTILDTLSDPEDLEDELAELFRAVETPKSP